MKRIVILYCSILALNCRQVNRGIWNWKKCWVYNTLFFVNPFRKLTKSCSFQVFYQCTCYSFVILSNSRSGIFDWVVNKRYHFLFLRMIMTLNPRHLYSANISLKWTVRLFFFENGNFLSFDIIFACGISSPQSWGNAYRRRVSNLLYPFVSTRTSRIFDSDLLNTIFW